IPYIEAHLAQGGRLNHITRHMIDLFQGLPGSRGWRRHLSENAHKPNADINVVLNAAEFVDTQALTESQA
ncbi:tRNA-dihydrouridine synthase, partial [Shewanella metallivivens]